MLIIKQDEGNFFFKKSKCICVFLCKQKQLEEKKPKMPKKEEVCSAVLGKPSKGDKLPHGTE